jgi:hypothetical protein
MAAGSGMSGREVISVLVMAGLVPAIHVFCWAPQW